MIGNSLEYVLGDKMLKSPEEIGRARKNGSRSGQRKTGEQESPVSTATSYQVVQRGGVWRNITCT